MKVPSAQQRLITFLRFEIERTREFPSRASIAAHMGWNITSVPDALDTLVVRGLLVRRDATPGTRRRYEYVLPEMATELGR